MVKIVDLRPSLTHSRHAPSKKTPPQKNWKFPKWFGKDQKPGSLKVRRRRARYIALVAIILFAVGGIYTVHWSSYRPSVRVQEVSVRGTTLQNPEDVSIYVRTHLSAGETQFIARDNIFSYPKEELRAGIIRNFPRLKSVRIGRSSFLGTTLIVNVDERTPLGTWCAPGAATSSCHVFDDSGLIFAQAEDAPRPDVAYLFFGGVNPENAIGSVFLPGKLVAVLDLLQRMREARFVPAAFHVLDEKDYMIDLENGYTIKASFGQSIDTIVHNLELVSVSEALRGRETELEYIDLRFGNRVYYKFKGEESPAPAEPEE